MPHTTAQHRLLPVLLLLVSAASLMRDAVLLTSRR
jgi:hypothetical protein